MKVTLVNSRSSFLDIHGLKSLWFSGHVDYPPLPLAYVASSVEKSGHSVSLIDTQIVSTQETIDDIQGAQPELLGIYVQRNLGTNAIEIAREIKKREMAVITVLWGPQSYSLMKDASVLKVFDYAVLGEGEITFTELLDSLKAGGEAKNTSGICFYEGGNLKLSSPRNCIQDLDELQFPARELLPPLVSYSSPVLTYRELPVAHILSSRICCSFDKYCNACEAKPIRYRSAENVLAEATELIGRYRARELRFVDSAFARDKDRLELICQGLVNFQRQVPWGCRVNARDLERETLIAMKEAGCWQVFLSLQERTLSEESVRAIHLAAEVGLNVRCERLVSSEDEIPDERRVLCALPIDSLYYLREEARENEQEDLYREAYASFYFRPSFVFKKLLKTGSFCQFQSTAVQYSILLAKAYGPKLRNALINILLMMTSMLCCLACVECVLRLYAPQYRAAAESRLEADSYRIWRPPINSIGWDYRPDTNTKHWVIHNSLGFRQHREFSPKTLENRTTIAIFGDSFIENRRVKSQHALNEVLDYLLNCVEPKFDVLNFGVEGYGLDQIYIHYSQSPIAQKSEHVVYVFCRNDIRNVYENDLLSVNGQGELVQRPARYSPWLARSAARLYTTYFLLDKLTRIFPNASWATSDRDLTSRDFERTWRDWKHIYTWNTKEADRASSVRNEMFPVFEVFRAILRTFKEKVERNKGTFTVVLLAFPEEQSLRELFPRDIRVVELYPLACELTGNSEHERWKFKTDEHYNEEGNLVSAVCLFDELSHLLGLKEQTREWKEKKLFTYYSAFPSDWQPHILTRETQVAQSTKEQIRQKYLALEPSAEISGERVYPPDYKIRCRVPNQENN